ncbi:MAG: acetyltransferase-like isoleucine patch superfamily enzyme [Parvicella sp.]|jgi:acetyltransferase-like isoleucine patch superfamily enzyme
MTLRSALRHLIARYKFKKDHNELHETSFLSLKAQIKNSKLDHEVRVADYASVKNSQIGYLTSIGRFSKVTHTNIGKYCAISWDVSINAISHPMENPSISAFPYVPSVGGFTTERIQQHKEVVILNDVWVGANSVIMPGVIIGNGAVIGASSVVTRDVPDYAVVVGAPAKIIKYRFNRKEIGELLTLEWWNLPTDILKSNISIFQKRLDSQTLVKLKKLKKSHEDEAN